MDERPTKRRGPIGWLSESRLNRWTAALLVAVPLFYVASIPPLKWCLHRGLIPQSSIRQRAFAYYLIPWLTIAVRSPRGVQLQMHFYSEILIP